MRSATLATTALLLLLASSAPAVARSYGGAQRGGSSATLAAIDRKLDRLGRHLRPLERSVGRFRRFMTCTRPIPVSEFGDVDHRFGYLYDEGDGTGLDMRPALAVDRSETGFSDYVFLRSARKHRCESSTTRPGTPEQQGTADDSRIQLRHGRAPMRRARHRLARIERRVERIEQGSERFDEWESCLSMVPVTEFGDPERRYGFVFGSRAALSGYRPALTIDLSEWDDPDYMILAFKGRDRPFRNRECESEPGEAIDARRASSEALEDLDADVNAVFEDLEDLREPVEEFETFDQCMYFLGASQESGPGKGLGYLFTSRGRVSTRPALAIHIRGEDRPQYRLLAFPSEEPPSIECNEDAAGLFTN